MSSPLLIVDVANVVGSRADGWWRDRAGAARRLVDQVRSRPPDDPVVVLVLEGAARSGAPESDDGRVRVVHAPGEGDDTVVVEAAALVGDGASVVVVTADRGLRERLDRLGVDSRGPRWFTDLLTS